MPEKESIEKISFLLGKNKDFIVDWMLENCRIPLLCVAIAVTTKDLAGASGEDILKNGLNSLDKNALLSLFSYYLALEGSKND